MSDTGQDRLFQVLVTIIGIAMLAVVCAMGWLLYRDFNAPCADQLAQPGWSCPKGSTIVVEGQIAVCRCPR